ncbi:MAG: hypothetical protein KJ592_04930, partial [Nanoarchaeota archaeon]|nr:hypothetical protein [Nanoarchaeota archaeon]
MKDINLFRTEDSIYLKKVKFKSEVLKEDSCDGYLICKNPRFLTNFLLYEKEARRIIERIHSIIRGNREQVIGNRTKIIAIVGGDDVFNRRVIETLKVDYLVSVECKT